MKSVTPKTWWPTPKQYESFSWAASHVAELIQELPLDGYPNTMTDRQVLDYVARVVLTVNMHKHTATCKKVRRLMPLQIMGGGGQSCKDM
jgi:hypothetical protein